MVITGPSLPADLDMRPGAVWACLDAEAKFLFGPPPPTIHDVVTWDWPARPVDYSHYWVDEGQDWNANHLYHFRLLAAGWITADGEVTW
jgi:hypothetical protein